MRRRLFLNSLFAASLFLPGLAVAQNRQELTVYTYESFTSEWGPGPQVEKAFEAECGCDLKFVGVADGVALLNRVKLEGVGTKADIVLGLDTNLTAEAKASGLFASSGVDTSAVNVPASLAIVIGNETWLLAPAIVSVPEARCVAPPVVSVAGRGSTECTRKRTVGLTAALKKSSDLRCSVSRAVSVKMEAASAVTSAPVTWSPST